MTIEYLKGDQEIAGVRLPVRAIVGSLVFSAF